MSTLMSSHVLVIDLSGEKPRVLRSFEHHRLRDSMIRDRVIKEPPSGVRDGVMGEGTVEARHNNEEFRKPTTVNVFQIAISSDGQWLATADDSSRTHIFNLDSMQVSAIMHGFLYRFLKKNMFLAP